MLSELQIKNYAIIDNIEIKLHKGLNIITGETGAGKSIIMGALGLILGNRADSSVLKNNEGKCIIEAYFSIENPVLLSLLNEKELDIEDNIIIIRREITNSGKSRSFINDTPVNLADLKTITSFLVDQHQQFDNLLLGKSSFQQEVVDTLAKNSILLKTYQQYFNNWMNAHSELQILLKKKEDFNKELDFLQFQYKELEEQDFKENELEELEEELKLIESAGDIKSVLNKISLALNEDENSLVNTLKSLSAEFKHYHINKELISIAERIKSAEIELKDIADESESMAASFNFDEERLNIINDRMSVGYKLLKKHSANTTNELLQIKENLETRLQQVLDIDIEIENKQQETENYHNHALETAKEVSERRKSQLSFIESTINDLLFRVGMPNAKLRVNIDTNHELKFYGIDTISFLFDANKTNNFEPIEKVASGGELSRLMLCIKSMVAKYIELPTLIFDEIDTGISGEAAKQVGIIMRELSDNLQVISITHQPQIASLANAHYYVYKKENKNNEINTQIRLLNKEERIEQIAQMLGGNNPTSSAVKTAKELIEKN